MTRIGLNMVVRNEAGVIERCLESVRPYVSHWTICDTGSTDGTPEIIERFMSKAGISGKLYHEEWVNFGHNRTLAIQHAQGTADYHLLLDADMVLKIRNGISTAGFADLKEDAYLLQFEGALDYSVIRLVSDRHEWRYIGATHEYVHADTAKAPVKLPGISVVHYEDGSSRAEKYERDIRLLTEDLAKDPNNPRATFYLAQSYRDSKQFEAALDWYEKRALMGGWPEETWNALYQLGCIQQALGYDWRVVLNSYLQAFNFRPSRLEAVCRITRFYREHQQWTLGYQFARLVTEYGYPEDILFVERPVYEYLLPFEYVICCHHAGRTEEAVRVTQILETEGKIPTDLLHTLKSLVSRSHVYP